MFWVFATPLILLVGAASALQIPYVQTKVVQYLGETLTFKTGFNTTVDYVSINWFDKISLEGVYIRDLNDSTMLHVNESLIDFTLSNVLSSESIIVDEVIINSADFRMFRNPDSGKLNIQEFIQAINESLRKEGNVSKPFLIREVKLFSTSYLLWDTEKEVREDILDLNHFGANNIKAHIYNLDILKDTVQMDIANFSGRLREEGTDIHSLSGFLYIDPAQIKISGLQASIGKSYISDEIIFEFPGFESLSDFVANVTVSASLNNCVLSTTELKLFVPQARNFNKVFTLSGDINGKVGNFRIRDFDLALGDQSLIKGQFYFNGLPDINSFYFDANISKSRLLVSDLEDYLPSNVYSKISKANDIYFLGKLSGSVHDFLAKGSFDTSIGRLSCDLTLKIPPQGSSQLFSYLGTLELVDFNLGELLETSDLQRATLKGNINGRGLTLETAVFSLDGFIEEIGIRNYDYSKITTNASFAKQYFDGGIVIADPNVKLSANGSIDLRDNKNKIEINGKLDTLFFKPIGLLNSETFLQTDFDVDVTGLHIDSLKGNIIIHNTTIINEREELTLDSLNLTSQVNKGHRTLKVNASDFSIDLSGNYNYTTAFRDISAMVKEFKLSLQNQDDSLAAYYSLKDPSSDNETYYIDYLFNLRDINPFIKLVNSDLTVSKSSLVQGRFTSGFTSILNLRTTLDTIQYKESSLYDNEIDISASKISDSTQILAMGYFYSGSQLLNGVTETKDMFTDLVWNNNEMDFNLGLEHKNELNRLDLYGTINFHIDSTTIHLKPSEIVALSENWRIDEKNLIASRGKEISIKDLTLFNKTQSITVNGLISENARNTLVINIDSVKLENINPVINRNLKGVINGRVGISDLYNRPFIDSRLDISDMYVNEFLVGNIQGKSEWIPQSELFEIEFDVLRKDFNIIDVTGLFHPFESENSLELTAKFKQANINILEPFIETIFSDLAGTMSGEFFISGTPLFPHINGTANILGGSVKVNYLNTSYRLEGGVAFSDSRISFENIEVLDIDNNTALISGEFIHNRFRNFALNLRGTMDNFQVLNTTARDNDLFYGNGKVTGDIQFEGPLSKLKITANAQTNRGTRLYIPIGDSESLESRDYITFVNFSSGQKSEIEIEEQKINLKGLILDFDLDITPDAYAEMIFDIQSGDIIRGRGNGKIKLQIDTQGDFAMLGDYQFVSGGYNFTLYNIINKEFTILPGSTISWAGDPYQGILAMQASYLQIASLAPLDTAIGNSPEGNRRYPTEVIMDLTGPLLTPNIEFDIKITQYPDYITLNDGQSFPLGSTVSSFLNKIAADEQELKRQVFSLVILKTFSQQQLMAGQNYIINSVSEFLSNQLSYWITQLDENLDIDVDLGQLDEEGFNAFQLRLSYTFLDGRLRVTRDGGFTDAENKADIASIAGDWTVEYSLTPEGKFRVKMYNKTNTNQALTTFNQSSNFTAGVSLIHTQSFDEVRNIFNASRKKRLEALENSGTSDASALKKEDDSSR